MASNQQQLKKQSTTSKQVEEVVTDEVSPERQAEIDALKAETDSMLDEIDGLLEENAADFVKAYVQKGGE